MDHFDGIRNELVKLYDGIWQGLELLVINREEPHYNLRPKDAVIERLALASKQLETCRCELEASRLDFIQADEALASGGFRVQRLYGAEAREAYQEAKAKLLEIKERQQESEERPLHEFGVEGLSMELYQTRLKREQAWMEAFGVAGPVEPVVKDTIIHKNKIEMAMERYQLWPFSIPDREFQGTFNDEEEEELESEYWGCTSDEEEDNASDDGWVGGPVVKPKLEPYWENMYY